MKKDVIYYETEQDEFVFSRDQNYKLKDDYIWIHESRIYNFISKIVYFIARMFANVYCRLILKVKFVNKDVLNHYKDKGIFIYGNHTLEMGDIFIPPVACGKKRVYVVADPANLGIPVIGKLLPMLAAIPVPEDFHRMKNFINAVYQRVDEKNCVVVYPEAHVWPYYNKIRNFEETSFRFPVETNAPVFSITNTYSKRRFGRKPKITCYVDGPFFPDEGLSRKEKRRNLRGKVYNQMLERSRESTYEYIVYRKAEKDSENI